MYRFVLIAVSMLPLSACTIPVHLGPNTGKVLFTEDSKDRYVQLREGQRFVVSHSDARVENRPELEHLREINDSLGGVCKSINGVDNPRIVIESKKGNTYYEVVCKWGDRDALKVIAEPLGLLVTEEVREIPAFTIRESSGGHRLKPAAEGKQVDVEEVWKNDDGWPLDGVTVDELARFLETHYHLPVVNMTGVAGKWSILLSEQVVKISPQLSEDARATPLDELGLELRWEKVKFPVIVVKDKPKDKRK